MNTLISAVHKASIGLNALRTDQFARIRRAIGDARVVLIGEETHGTQEFYALRAELTKALIEDEGFSLVLCESDFPTFYKLHQFVGGTHASRKSLASSSSASSSSASTASPPRSPTLSPSASTPLLAADAKTTTPLYGTAVEKDYPTDDALATVSTDPTVPLPRITADEVMDALKERFPVWMWRNEVVRDFVQWLQHENLRRALAEGHAAPLPVALFGLDIYSMFASTDQVILYLDAVDPAMAERARRRYSVLQQFRPHEERYARSVLSGRVASQHNPIKRMVHELHDKATEFKNVLGDGDEYFNAYENARIVQAAEAYYRQSYLGGSAGDSSWNIRDRAMVEMILDALAFHDEKLQQAGHGNHQARAVVWAHNSHVGDGAATELYTQSGQVNVGHLVREALGENDCYLIGLTTATGTVRAAHRWNGRDHVMRLQVPLQGSIGDTLHSVAAKRVIETGEAVDASFGVVFRSHESLTPEETVAQKLLETPRLERFVGVQYHNQRERQAHYSQCRLSNQFDMVIHVDTTTALRPLPEELASEPHEATMAVRTGTVGYSKWDRMFAQDQEDEDEDEDDDDKE